MPSAIEAEQVLHFWFKEAKPEQKFSKDPEFDQTIRNRFEKIWQQAKNNELAYWRVDLLGRLAEIIVLDQFSRNLCRDSAEAFAQDAQALALAQEALRHPGVPELTPEQKAFLYMPFMHSESAVIHQVAMKLFSEKGLEDNLKFEILHKEIIERFGRYPHRNEVLGRKSTPEELHYLRTTDVKF